jgi:hypothetical protein
VAAKIGDKMKTTLDAIDEAVFKITGKKKEGTEKTSEYVARMMNETKAAGGSDANLKQLYEQAQQALNEKKDFVDPKTVTGIKEKHFDEKVSWHIATAQAGMTFAVPAHITDEKEKQAYIENQKRLMALDIRSRFKPTEDKDGNITFSEGDKILMDTETGKPMGVGQIMTNTYKGYLAPEKGKPGAGSGPAGGGGNTDPSESELKTKDQVNEHLSKKYPNAGIGEAERTADYKRIIKEQGITE